MALFVYARKRELKGSQLGEPVNLRVHCYTFCMPDDSVRDTLLRASTLLYQFRALKLAESAERRAGIELHIVQLINELTDTDGGFVVMAAPELPLKEVARAREFPALESAVLRAEAEGIIHEGGFTAAPLYVHGKIAGAIGMMGPDCSEVLGAVVTLASAALESAAEVAELQRENTLLRSSPAGAMGIIGESSAIRHLRALIARVAPQDATVLVLGESGTGKELVARAIHAGSPRAPKPFMAINCAALTETLLESELFGHEKGAFTGAVERKKGKLEAAEGGTVFLDEIGELAPGLQAKLLRVLQERTFERVGGTQTIPLNIRLVAATNRDLAAEAKSAGFRLDLYHRLNVVPLKTSPLREHPEDIPILAQNFLDAAAARCGRRIAGLGPETVQVLMRYPWPGNVRELQNAIEHGAILGVTEWILPEDLPEAVLEAVAKPNLPSAYVEALSESRRECVIRAWREAGGDHNEAARKLGMHSNSLRRLIRQLELRKTLAAL
jgi:DNA-binding NtrC family response regulator